MMIPLGSTVEFEQTGRRGRGIVVQLPAYDYDSYGVHVLESYCSRPTPGLHTLGGFLTDPVGWHVQPCNIKLLPDLYLSPLEQQIQSYCDKELGR